MKLAVQYVSDTNGTQTAVQLPISDWRKVLNKLRKYEQALNIRTGLTEAFDQVAALQRPGAKKESLQSFLDEL